MGRMEGLCMCAFIIALDVVAGICGIEAEIAENKAKHMKLWIFECKNPSHEAYKLGLAAASLLAFSHIITNLLGGCNMLFCCQQEPQKSYPVRQCTTACLLLSWIIAIAGLFALVIGTRSNDKLRASCGFSHHHLMSIGGILCFVHAMASVGYYVSATSGDNSVEQ